MDITHAQLPPRAESADRVFTTPRAAVVLDGATAFTPSAVSAATYADVLGRRLTHLLRSESSADLAGCLSASIEYTVAELDVCAGGAASSTVSVVRETEHTVDVLVLGDSPVVVHTTEKTHILVDDRLDRLELPEEATYRERLAQGTGFDDKHVALLTQLQERQTTHRNVPGGYWIAATDASAAERALWKSFDKNITRWAVICTDGAYDPLQFLALDDWSSLVGRTAGELQNLLCRCYIWEEDIDSGGRLYPRAKKHDDKTLVVITFD